MASSTIVVSVFPSGPQASNCVIVGDTAEGKALVIDPGSDGELVLAELEKHRLRLGAILLTRGHVDAVLGYPLVRNTSNRLADVMMHSADLPVLRKWREQCSDFRLEAPADFPMPNKGLEDGQEITIGQTVRCVCIHTPGMTPGSMAFHFEDLGFVVTGATLMQRSVGRTDWAGCPSLEGTADANQILDSVSKRLLPLPIETQVISGHGPLTTIGAERKTNPFIKGLSQRWRAYDRVIDERQKRAFNTTHAADGLPF
eukprot:g3792.t1